jgi:flavin-dependent thymidylate synthase
MRVSLLDYTGSGHPSPWYAADLMIFTKNTRVKLSPTAREEIAAWDEDKKLQELDYMANTIPGSWEFCDYTFLVEGVTRSLTHQMVRTRTASYAQQTMQILDVGDFEYKVGKTVEADPEALSKYRVLMREVAHYYQWAVRQRGLKIADVREVLPTGILTNIVMKGNLRTFVDLFHSRISPRNLDDFRDLCVAMREEMIRVHPWSTLFHDRTVDRATEELDKIIRQQMPGEAMTPGTPMNKALKLVDQIRRKG